MNENLKGKIPPQAIEIEKAVLGALMVDSSAMDFVVIKLSKDIFYLPEHQNYYTAIKALYDSNTPIDLLTVVEMLKKKGGFKETTTTNLIEITNSIASTANIEYHTQILVEMYVKREVIRVSNEVLRMAYDEEVLAIDLLEKLGKTMSEVEDVVSTDASSQTWEEALISLPQRVEMLTNSKGEVTGLPTGLKALDKHFSGWQPTDFVVIGADSGMGKTAFVMGQMLACAKAGKAVGMFSMEMSVFQLATRAVAVESDFHMNQLMRNGFEKTKYFETLYKVIDRMKDLPIHIDDKPALTVSEMKRKARAMARKFGIKMLVIDFLQMFSGDKEMRINVGDAARECKNIAKELGIVVIALSQISREVRKSKYHLPKKYHLKEASAIEEAADVICMLYRPDYYGYDKNNYSDLYDELGLIGEENAALIVEKNRNGSQGNVGLRYIENKTKYVDGNEGNDNETLI